MVQVVLNDLGRAARGRRRPARRRSSPRRAEARWHCAGSAPRARRTSAAARTPRQDDNRYLVFNEGYTGDVDLAAEAIRLTRQLASMTDDEETAGLPALMLLHHARRPARTRRDGSLVPLAEQDRQ
jgi:predicted RNA polymerase sigma factor